jgi:large subunit ribosomal protein L25
MKKVSLSGSPREDVGKKDAKALRKENLVPCVIYGGKEQVHFATDERSFKKIVFTPEVCFVDIDVAGKKYSAILQDIQYHPINDKILHADFLELTGKPIKLDVPVRLEGISPGVLKGGRLAQKLRKVPIRTLPDKMPEEIVVSISDLDIGDKVKVSEIKSDSYEVLLSANAVLVMIMKARGADVAEEGEETAEPTAASE